MARFQILSVDEPTGNYAPIVPPDPATVRAARLQVAGRVPADEVGTVLQMLGLS